MQLHPEASACAHTLVVNHRPGNTTDQEVQVPQTRLSSSNSISLPSYFYPSSLMD